MTYFYKGYFRKSKKKNFALMLFIIILIIIFIFLFIPKSKKQISSDSFYLVYSENALPSESEIKCEKVSNLGGAGVAYNLLGKLYIIVGVYYSLADAQSVLKNINETFPKSGVIKVASKTISSKTSIKIKQNLVCKNFYYCYQTFLQELYNISLEYEKGDESLNDVYKKILKFKNEISMYENNLKHIEASVASSMHTCAIVVKQYLQDFFSSAFISSNVKKYIKKLNVLLVLEYINLVNLL